MMILLIDHPIKIISLLSCLVDMHDT